MASTDYFKSRPTVRSRPSLGTGLTAIPGSPTSPHTPALSRSISSQFGSPGSYRVEEESIVYEIGSRCLRAGFAGESHPRCIFKFGPDESRRVDDYRAWQSGARRNLYAVSGPWASDHELWTLDVRGLDLGLTRDKIERAVRESHTKYLMLDQKQRRVVLAVPYQLPHPLLEVTLRAIFLSMQPSSISLWTNPLLSTISAGLRSALVVDIGWHESRVTAMYEYRHVFTRTSVRGSKMLTQEMAAMLAEEVAKANPVATAAQTKVSFDAAEDISTRMSWCQPSAAEVQPELSRAVTVPIQLATTIAPSNISVPFPSLARPAEKCFFATPDPEEQMDDNELPLPILAYRCLLALPLDVRALCVSRIVVTGGCSNIPGLKARLIHEIEQLVASRGWDPVMNYGSVAGKRSLEATNRISTLPVRQKTTSATQEVLAETDEPARSSGVPTAEETAETPASDRLHDRDEISEKLAREAAKRDQPIVKGVIRAVETLGPWTGASIVASLKVEGVLEVRRDDFLKNGLPPNVGAAI